MGERCDNFMYAFNGRSLDWSLVFGARFNDVPKSWATVYRECPVEDLVRIAREGVTSPDPEMRNPEARREMEMLDKYRPSAIVRRGISRVESIATTPAPEDDVGPYGNRAVVLEVRVDPDRCFVCENDHLEYLAPVTANRRTRTERYRNAFKKYWESGMPFGDFLRHYALVETIDDMHWVRKPRAPKRLPNAYFAPEVLVLDGVISPQYVRIARSAVITPQAMEGEFRGEDGYWGR